MSKAKTVIPAKGGIPKGSGVAHWLRFPEFRDAGEWKVVKLQQLGELISGLTYSPNDTRDEGLLVLRSSNVQDGTISLKDNVYVRPDIRGAILSEPNDILICVRNGSKPLIGKNALIPEGLPPSTHGAFMTVFRSENAKFIYQLFQTNAYQSQVEADLGATINSINGNQLKKFEFCIPELRQEQQKIADCLSSLDDLITAQTEKIDALKTNKKWLMQQLFPREDETTPRLRFPKFRDAGEWDITPLGKAAKNLDSKRIPVTGSARVKGDVPYYGATGIIDYVKDYIFDEELLCISEDGANLVARNYPIAFSISGKTWVNNHAHVLRFKSMPTQVIVENYLNSISLKDFLTGMAQPKLNRAKLDIIPIPLPGIKEQQKIASCLSSFDALIAAQTEKLDALKTHKKGLMQQLFPMVERG